MIEDYDDTYVWQFLIEDTANRLAIDRQFQQKRRPDGQGDSSNSKPSPGSPSQKK